MTIARLSSVPLFVSSLLVAIASWRFVGLGLDAAFPPFAEHLSLRREAFAAHVIAAPIALALGMAQFLPRLRARRPGLHRWTGRVYAASILVGGLSGFWLALFPQEGWAAGAGFAVLAVLWILTTGKAVAEARAGRFAAHREWMIRSFALTFAGVTLRLQLAGFAIAGVDYFAASTWLAWACWVPNLVAAEWIVARGRRRAGAAA